MKDLKESFLQEHPNTFFLDPNNIEDTQSYLATSGWLLDGEVLHTQSKAGEGNMNCTLRLQTSHRSLILKQARPWVEKYPSIPAPDERAVQEATFYQFIENIPGVSSRMPTLLGMDAHAKTILMEDLGVGSDLLSLYQQNTQCEHELLDQLAGYLGALHSLEVDKETRQTLTNQAMRELNHLHIFALPLDPENGLDLDAMTPGLQAIASILQEDETYRTTVRKTGRQYLSDGPTLQHGDFYPGSWLQTDNTLYVLDPEFGYFGHASFDVGICIGHLILARQSFETIKYFIEAYRAYRPLEVPRALAYAGIEIMRRLIGVAQLPIEADIEQKTRWLTLSHKLVLQPGLSLLQEDNAY